jgi:glucokinase
MPRKRVTTRGKKLPHFIGFDLGGTKLASGVVSADGRVLESRRERVDFTRGVEGFLDFLGNMGTYWMERYPGAAALGIASAGPLDVQKGILLGPTNFPKWGDVPVAGPLHRRLGIPVYMDNDAAAAAAAEGWVGGARDLDNWILLTFGTGLGTGVVINRHLFMGGAGLGPEAGHIIITDKPYLCGCGNRGCAESILSGTALRHRIEEQATRWAKKTGEMPRSPEELVTAARAGDEVALGIFDEFSEYLARAIYNYAVLFAPQKVFLSGGLSSAVDLFVARASALVVDLLATKPIEPPLIELSELGDESGVLGGAWVAGFRLQKKIKL